MRFEEESLEDLCEEEEEECGSDGGMEGGGIGMMSGQMGEGGCGQGEHQAGDALDGCMQPRASKAEDDPDG